MFVFVCVCVCGFTTSVCVCVCVDSLLVCVGDMHVCSCYRILSKDVCVVGQKGGGELAGVYKSPGARTLDLFGH